MHRTGQISGLLALFIALSPAVPHDDAGDVPSVSNAPIVTTLGASAEQSARLAEALATFRTEGLELPDLHLVFSQEPEPCRGHMGLFDAKTDPWTIIICSQADFVYEHELAHAWEAANLTDEVRTAFMEFRGHKTWAGPEGEWADRGVEGVAFVIQQGLLDRPVSGSLSDEQASRLAAFELLTGSPSPRLGY